MQAPTHIVDAGIHLMPAGEADALAASLNADGDGWEYRPIHNNHVSGLSDVEIADETGQPVGRL